MDLNDWIIDERGNKIHSSAIIGDNVELGNNNMIYPLAILGMPGFIRDSESASGKIIIGDNNKIGNNVSIMVGQEENTIIGNNNLIMNYVNIGHDVTIGNVAENAIDPLNMKVALTDVRGLPTVDNVWSATVTITGSDCELV